MMGDELCLRYEGESKPWEGVGTVIKLPDAVSDEVRCPHCTCARFVGVCPAPHCIFVCLFLARENGACLLSRNTRLSLETVTD